MEIRVITKIALIIFLYYVVYSIYNGFLYPIPAPGDSWDYHIPIEHMILNGTFIHPTHITIPQWYYPGSSEAINALFILSHIPLTLSNLFAAIILFFCCWKLASIFKLDYYYSLLFSLTFCSLNVVVRWFNAVSIDMWVGVFFCLGIILFENPKKTVLYALQLGFVLGMLIGSKYTAIIFLLVLIVFYYKKFTAIFSFSRFIAFLIPFSLFGLFWYIRNYLLLGNPFYPLSVFGFKGVNLFTQTIWSVTIHHPGEMFNAFFGEYKLWTIGILVPFGYFIHKFFLKNFPLHNVGKLFLFGLINGIFFLQFPTSDQPWIMVSSFRYSYPVFIPLILGIFIIAKQLNKEVLLGYFAVANMIIVTSLVYAPKLVIFYLPLALFCFYLLEKYAPKVSNVLKK